MGGGFGGLQAALKLRRAPVQVTLVDRRNFHLFQPLLYQVATGALSPGEIASPLRGVLKRQRNARWCWARSTGIDLDGAARDAAPGRRTRRRELPYDTLIVAAGARHSYFGHDEWATIAPGLKSLEDALEMRRAHPERVRGGRGRARPEVAARAAHLRRGGRRADRRRAGRPDRRDRARHGAPRLPPHRPDHGGDPAGRGRPTGCSPPSRETSRARPSGSSRSSGSPSAEDRLVVGVDADGVTLSVATAATRSASRRAPSSGRPVSPPRRWPPRSPQASGRRVDRAGPHHVEPDLTLPGPPGGLRPRRHGPGLRRRGRADPAPRRGAGGHAAGALRGQGRPGAPGRRRPPRRRSTTSTRATWRRSGA